MHLPRRFDNALMRAPDAHGRAHPELIATLRACCEGGTAPTLAEPLRAASLAPSAGLAAATCVLDGSQELARLGRWRGLRWRLQILWREQVAGQDAQPANPWDCGWWRDGPLRPAEVCGPPQVVLDPRGQPVDQQAARPGGIDHESRPHGTGATSQAIEVEAGGIAPI